MVVGVIIGAGVVGIVGVGVDMINVIVLCDVMSVGADAAAADAAVVVVVVIVVGVVLLLLLLWFDIANVVVVWIWQ